MAISEQDVQQLFERLWHAQREAAICEERARIKKLESDQAELELREAKDQVERVSAEINERARRVAGIPSPEPESARRGDGYVPVGRRLF
jgi:hypothetical protein